LKFASQTTRQHHPVVTAEREPFARESMNGLIDLARDCISELMKVQNQVLNNGNTIRNLSSPLYRLSH